MTVLPASIMGLFRAMVAKASSEDQCEKVKNIVAGKLYQLYSRIFFIKPLKRNIFFKFFSAHLNKYTIET